MVAAAMKYMASNFAKLNNFEGMVRMLPWNNSGRGPSGIMMTMFADDFKHILKHQKEELTLIKLGSHLRIEKSLKLQDSDKPKGNNVAGLLVVNMVEYNNSFRMMMLHGGLIRQQTMDDVA
ncbi:hypothetical protein Tco_0998538 [Tanacetum coccineum]